MFYSCFDSKTGLYDYFADSSSRPINSDLPIPKLPESVGRIGVPAIEAGRELPSNAKPAGKGWHARGMIVTCGRSGSSLGAFDASSNLTRVLAGGAVALGLVYFFGRPARPATYAALGVLGGVLGYALGGSGGTA